MSWEKWGTAIVENDTPDNFFKAGATNVVETNKDFAGVDLKISGSSGDLGGTPKQVFSSTSHYSSIVQPDKYFTVKRDERNINDKKLIFTVSTKNDYDKYLCVSRSEEEGYQWNGEECVKKPDTTNGSGGRRRRRRKSRKSRRKSRKTKRKRRKSRKTKKRRKRRR